jgi:hypothetical protein
MSIFNRKFYLSILGIFGEDQVYSFDPLLINIDKFIHQIEKGGLDLTGIYRVSATNAQLDILMKDFQKFSYFDVKKWDVVDKLYVIPSLFKRFIREVPLIKNHFLKLLSKPFFL